MNSVEREYKPHRLTLKSTMISLSAFLVLWQFAVWLFDTAEYVLPSPFVVTQALFQDRMIILHHLGPTFLNWGLGVLLSVALSLGVWICCYWSDRLDRFLVPILTLSQSVPTLAIAPLLMVWFGIGMAPKLILVTMACFFPIAVGLLSGLQASKDRYSRLISILRLSKFDALRQVHWYGSLSAFFIGLRVSASYAFVASVMVELIGSENGLGIYLIRAQSSYRTEAVIGAVAIMIAVSLVTTIMIDALQRRVVFWRDSV